MLGRCFTMNCASTIQSRPVVLDRIPFTVHFGPGRGSVEQPASDGRHGSSWTCACSSINSAQLTSLVVLWNFLATLLWVLHRILYFRKAGHRHGGVCDHPAQPSPASRSSKFICTVSCYGVTLPSACNKETLNKSWRSGLLH